VRLIRGETSTAGDLSTLRSIIALGEGEEPSRGRRLPVGGPFQPIWDAGTVYFPDQID
jgi:hypothetical protein